MVPLNLFSRESKQADYIRYRNMVEKKAIEEAKLYGDINYKRLICEHRESFGLYPAFNQQLEIK